MALKLLSDAARVCAVQGLRREATQAFVEGVETPHGRASEVLHRLLQRPPERPLPSGAAKRTDIAGTSAATRAGRASA